jgi:hypothetical protein
MKTEVERFRLTAAEKLAIRKAAKRAKIGVSALIRLCIVSPRHVGSKPEAIRAALGK